MYSVDVLGETEEIASPEQLDVKRYGVIVAKESNGDFCFRIWKELIP